jgi:peptidoglycan-associated lipoprotein
MVFLVVILVAALSGCGCFYQAVRGEKVPPAPTAAAVQKAQEKPAQEMTVAPAQKSTGSKEAMLAALKDIHFEFDKYDIRPGDADLLKGDFGWFQHNPGTRVKIEGNCDERGTVEYNLVLGQKRADSAKGYLTTLGVDPKLLDTISYGKERPVDPGHNETAWAKNRRDHFVEAK